MEVLVVANAFPSRTAQSADAAAARVRALAAWENFLSLWKDADPDIPILKEAKAEYPKLQSQWKVPPPRLLVDYGLRNQEVTLKTHVGEVNESDACKAAQNGGQMLIAY